MDLKNIVTKNLDHLGLVASIAKDLEIVERIDKRLEQDQSSVHVSIGERTLGINYQWIRLYR